MSSSKSNDWGNKPIIVIIGFIAAIITIVVFLSGKQSIGEFASEPASIPSNPISAQPVAPLQQLEPQFDPNDPEGFLRWYFHEVWDSRNYGYLWTYLSDDFTQRLNLSYSNYEENWSAIGSVEEPIGINYEGKDGISLKYRVQYTTLSLKGNYPDRRKDLYWLYFSQNKGHWEFR